MAGLLLAYIDLVCIDSPVLRSLLVFYRITITVQYLVGRTWQEAM